jgi:hypothetical protein
MPRPAPENAEEILVSPEDDEVFSLFSFRRSFNKDGSLRYVQVLGTKEELEAFSNFTDPDYDDEYETEPGKVIAVSLPRIIACRMEGRSLEDEEVITQRNGLKGDCRRDNLEIKTKSEVASGERPHVQWADSGTKYVYSTEGGRYFVNYKGQYIGSFDTVEIAEKAIELYLKAVDEGMEEKVAAKYARKKIKFGDGGRN